MVLARRARGLAALIGWAALATAAPAGAWTRAGHMVGAAIAYDELEAHDPQVIDRIVAIMEHHPERGPFEVAIGRATGRERKRLIFLEMARWADDVRGGAQDHPTWHAAFRPVIDTKDPPPVLPSTQVVYEAFEALDLAVHTADDGRAPDGDRAVSLCWILHIVTDIHQPLHAGELYSGQFPDGDRYGAREFLLDPETGQPENLHWFWDDSVWRSDDPAGVMARAHALEAQYPRQAFADALSNGRRLPPDIKAWADESLALAQSVAYAPNRPRAASTETAVKPDPAYVDAARRTAARQLTLAGYRLADLLETMFGRPQG